MHRPRESCGRWSGCNRSSSRSELIVERTKISGWKEFIYSEIERLSLPKLVVLVAGLFALGGISQQLDNTEAALACVAIGFAVLWIHWTGARITTPYSDLRFGCRDILAKHYSNLTSYFEINGDPSIYIENLIDSNYIKEVGKSDSRTKYRMTYTARKILDKELDSTTVTRIIKFLGLPVRRRTHLVK